MFIQVIIIRHLCLSDELYIYTVRMIHESNYITFGLYFHNSRLLYESPRWLAATGKMEKAVAVLRKIAAINNNTLPEDLKVTISSNKVRHVHFPVKLSNVPPITHIICFSCSSMMKINAHRHLMLGLQSSLPIFLILVISK